MSSQAKYYLECVARTASAIDSEAVERLATALAKIRDSGGRIFFLGVGGSAANAGHAVNDFRKLARLEAYAPTDNVSELTARTNDEGWETVFEAYLQVSRANEHDAVFVLSVGGGDLERNVSPNIVCAVDYARQRGLKVLGIVGRDGGYTKRWGDEVVIVPTVDAQLVTPLTESFQAVICHCLVSHPLLQATSTKW